MTKTLMRTHHGSAETCGYGSIVVEYRRLYDLSLDLPHLSSLDMKIRSFICFGLLSLGYASIAEAQHFIHGEGFLYTDGPSVAVNDNVHVAVKFNSGSSFMDPNAHYAVGGWGRGLNDGTGIPSGRGVAIGSFSQAHTGACVGVMIEDFTDNQGDSGGIPDADDGNETNDHDGLIGPCHSVNFKNYTTYKVDVLISFLNVYWYLSEYAAGEYVLVAEGGWAVSRCKCNMV